MSGRKLQGRYDNTQPCSDPSGPQSAQNTHITGCLDTSDLLQSQYGNLRATPDWHLGNHTNAASKFGWQAAERDRESEYEVCVWERRENRWMYGCVENRILLYLTTYYWILHSIHGIYIYSILPAHLEKSSNGNNRHYSTKKKKTANCCHMTWHP